MVPETTSEVWSPPSREKLLRDFGANDLSIQALFRFCFVPGGRLGFLRDLTLEEEWGSNHFVLIKYLAVHLRLAIEQGRYVWNDDQLVMTAGSLATKSGAPLYVGIVRNSAPEENPWVLNWVGERPSCSELPEPADLGEWPALCADGEVILACDLSDKEGASRAPELEDLPEITRICALTGAIHWALHRGIAVRQIHGGGRGYFVPVWLRSREDLESPPDLVAPVVAQGRRVIVRTLLDPHVAYSPARVAVERAELLPAWLLESWAAVGGERTEEHE